LTLAIVLLWILFILGYLNNCTY